MVKQYNTQLQERLEKFLKDENLSQAKAAPILGISQAVAIAFGWLVGVQYRIRENNYISYQKGYHEGLAKKTVIIEQPQGRCSFMIDERYVEM